MDNQLKAALQKIVNLSTEDKVGLAFAAIKALTPEIREHFTDEEASVAIAAIFSTAAVADGKLSDEEYALIKTFFQAFEIDMDDDTLTELIVDLSAKEAYAAVLSLNDMLSKEGKTYLISLVAAICAIDDRIEPTEVMFLSDLYKA